MSKIRRVRDFTDGIQREFPHEVQARVDLARWSSGDPNPFRAVEIWIGQHVTAAVCRRYLTQSYRFASADDATRFTERWGR